MRGHSRRLFGLAAVGLALVALAGGAQATAAASLRPAPGTPDPRSMVLTSADLGGAKVTRQSYYKDRDFPSVISYTREFDKGRSGATQLIYASSDAEVGIDEATTTRYLGAVRKALGTKQGRKLIANSFADALGAASLLSKIDVSKPRSLGAGAGSFDVLVTVRILGVRTQLHLAVFSLERVLGAVSTAGVPGRVVPLSVMTRLAKTMQQRMATELSPRNLSAPTIAGSPELGQTLTATTGTWSGVPTAFDYQWQRCDEPTTTCMNVPGATSETYGVTEADIGSRLRVGVTGRNSVGSASAMSLPTLVVIPPPTSGSPRIVVRPSIIGTAKVGETLTASTGTWTGNPTSFGFAWVRCPANLVGCGETVPGATQGSYVVSPADVGSQLWVDVTAANEFGQTRTSSLPTALVVP